MAERRAPPSLVATAFLARRGEPIGGTDFLGDAVIIGPHRMSRMSQIDARVMSTFPTLYSQILKKFKLPNK